jgi:hypothetical protein
MTKWVRATEFSYGIPGNQMYINLAIVTQMEWVGNRTEIKFGGGSQISVTEPPETLIGRTAEIPPKVS